ncbi:hypothetical protein C7N43_08550 [Sphingobacteriales bacterium UPWRP_1]|nr:hypothetical protein B6N25_09405 [Sphingobacteriales bacterium TSM_CSS]PSJ77497.1 hypothetical protein C7N43_08550 [Sphingobacteriales bacterium UPWRP_1]
MGFNRNCFISAFLPSESVYRNLIANSSLSISYIGFLHSESYVSEKDGFLRSQGAGIFASSNKQKQIHNPLKSKNNETGSFSSCSSLYGFGNGKCSNRRI